MLLKKHLITAGLLVFVFCAYSQAKKTSVKPAKTAHAPVAASKTNVLKEVSGDNSLLYEISGHGLQEPSYLFGTMHVVCAEDATLSAGLKEIIRSSKQVFFEVDLDDLQETMGALQFMRMNDNRKISDLLTPVEYDRVKHYFDSVPAGIPFVMMNRFKPIFVSALIGENLLDCKNKSMMEQDIMTEIKKYEKNIQGLETLEFQASLFDTIPYETQARDLLNYVDSIDTYKSLMKTTVAMYRSQDIGGLDSLTRIGDPAMSKYLDLMLYDRNKRWVSQITEQAFQMSTLFAVGAGHLGGEKGLVNQLRKEGFTVKALKN